MGVEEWWGWWGGRGGRGGGGSGGVVGWWGGGVAKRKGWNTEGTGGSAWAARVVTGCTLQERRGMVKLVKGDHTSASRGMMSRGPISPRSTWPSSDHCAHKDETKDGRQHVSRGKTIPNDLHSCHRPRTGSRWNTHLEYWWRVARRVHRQGHTGARRCLHILMLSKSKSKGGEGRGGKDTVHSSSRHARSSLSP